MAASKIYAVGELGSNGVNVTYTFDFRTGAPAFVPFPLEDQSATPISSYDWTIDNGAGLPNPTDLAAFRAGQIVQFSEHVNPAAHGVTSKADLKPLLADRRSEARARVLHDNSVKRKESISMERDDSNTWQEV